MADKVDDEQLKRIQDSFRNFDKDGDGSISREELRDIMFRISDDDDADKVEEQVDRLMKICDKDNSGTITFVEFFNALRNKKMDELDQQILQTLLSFLIKRRVDQEQIMSAHSDHYKKLKEDFAHHDKKGQEKEHTDGQEALTLAFANERAKMQEMLETLRLEMEQRASASNKEIATLNEQLAAEKERGEQNRKEVDVIQKTREEESVHIRAIDNNLKNIEAKNTKLERELKEQEGVVARYLHEEKNNQDTLKALQEQVDRYYCMLQDKTLYVDALQTQLNEARDELHVFAKKIGEMQGSEKILQWSKYALVVIACPLILLLVKRS